MQVEITESVRQVRVIEVDIPYYFEHDLSDSNDDYERSYIIYGKIEQTKTTTIREKITRCETSYEVEVKTYESIRNSGMASYFGSQYKSSKKDFDNVKERCVNLLSNVT